MFLVNVPPVVAFQTKWAPFGQAASGRLPVCFSESEEDLSGIPIGAQVQGIINNLQSDESSLEVNSEYECIMQKNRKVELNISGGLNTGSTVVKGHTKESATLVVPAQFNDHNEDNSAFGPLVLESDSDDSVDRGIEEAIQEYLKKKSNVVPSQLSDAKSSSSIEHEVDFPKDGQKNASITTCPVKIDMVTTTNDICDSFKAHDQIRSASPDSVSSDDSFEQSIKDEIEQFLNEKKLQSNKSEISSAKKNVQNETPVKPKLKSSKTSEKQSAKQGCKEPFVGQHLEVLNVQSKGQKTKVDSFKNTNIRSQPKPKISKQNEKLKIQPKEAVSILKEELTDSSSDDGIEEAIQLYQLEKIRNEGNLKIALGAASVKEQKVNIADESAVNFSHSLGKNASPELYKKTENRKRKMLNTKPAALPDIPNCQPLTHKRTFSSIDDRIPKCETGLQATCRAETATELLCAEAILDISKTILPSQPESTLTALQGNSCPHSEAAQPYCYSDSSVDSDDSIEQEIRTFLALKAQTEGICTDFRKQEPSSIAPTPEHQNQSSFSKRKLSLTHKRKLKESKPAQANLMKKGNHLEKVSLCVDSGELSKYLLPNDNVQSSCVGSCTDTKSKLQYPSDVELNIGQQVLGAERAFAPSIGKSRGNGKAYVQIKSYCTGDKSSSLDSDEDLDTAIKDLLKSKRKFKKRSKDERPQCKKKVRFGETTTKPLEIFDGFEQKDCHVKGPFFIKSCLLNPGNTQGNPLKKSKSTFKIKEEQEKQDTVGSRHLSVSSHGSKACGPKPVCASDNTMTSESKSLKTCAFSDAQDSSSVDSDDSIELEIRKFLAARAKASADLTAAQKEMPNVPDPNLDKGNNTHSFKQEQRGLLNTVKETVLQSGEDKKNSERPTTQNAVVHQLYDCKQSISHIGQLYHRPIEVNKGTSPVNRQDGLLVKSECFVDQNNVLKQNEKCLQTIHGRAVMKAELNGSQGKSHLPVSGNFVAGLKYISGNDKRLVLNLDTTGPSKITGDVNPYKTGTDITKLGSCPSVQKKGLILEKSKDVQTSNIFPKNPLVHPGLYLLTTKMCKDPSSLCVPIKTASYETGINVMSVQYSCAQVVSNALPCAGELSIQQHTMGEVRDGKISTVSANSKTGEALQAPALDTKIRVFHSAREVLDCESRQSNLSKEKTQEDLEAGSGINVKECKGSEEKGKVSSFSHFSTSIDPGLSVLPYIILSPEQICQHFGLHRNTRTRSHQEAKNCDYILPRKFLQGEQKRSNAALGSLYTVAPESAIGRGKERKMLN
ncbi:hypothetical protein FKM82_005456 [Ascaphus truei]